MGEEIRSEGERVRGPEKDMKRKQKKEGNEKGWGGSKGKARGEDRDGWRKTGKKFSSI